VHEFLQQFSDIKIEDLFWITIRRNEKFHGFQKTHMKINNTALVSSFFDEFVLMDKKILINKSLYL